MEIYMIKVGWLMVVADILSLLLRASVGIIGSVGMLHAIVVIVQNVGIKSAHVVFVQIANMGLPKALKKKHGIAQIFQRLKRN